MKSRITELVVACAEGGERDAQTLIDVLTTAFRGGMVHDTLADNGISARAKHDRILAAGSGEPIADKGFLELAAKWEAQADAGTDRCKRIL